MSDSTGWGKESGLNLDKGLRAECRRRLIAGSGWAVNNQVRHAWPRWDANAGRFPYHIHMPTDDYFLSTVWNTARLAQGLLSAWQALGTKAYLAAAERALQYLKSLQLFAPEQPEVRGAFFEETPQGYSVGARDGVEAAQAFMAHYFAAKDKVSLVRACAYLDWLLNLTTKEKSWEELGWCTYAAPIPLVQCAAVTGNRQYVTRAAAPAADAILGLIGADGALRVTSNRNDHHVPSDDGVVFNDDGLGVALLCVWKATGRKKYLDAAVAMGEWWLTNDKLPKAFAMVPASMIFLADLARATGDARYTTYASGLCRKLFAMQAVKDERVLVQGGFIGEDRAASYRAGSKPEEFISIRTTSLALIAMAKLAARGSKHWPSCYSAFGF